MKIGFAFGVEEKEKHSTTFGYVILKRKKLKKLLKKRFNDLEKYKIDKSNCCRLIDNESFRKLFASKIDLTFIDIIKGIFPLKLSNFLKDEIKMNNEDRIKISIAFLDFIYDETKIIWKEHCDLQIAEEKMLKINKKKKLNTGSSGYVNQNVNRSISSVSQSSRVESLQNNIWFSIFV
ncbi:hypothetical protein RhiirA4_467958 [Rhizophagus irregularis]|uniref:Uncharacterized protein n=1 Tax=Rhizophagus irregularis TaxID=588596 RepID=A0A2I1GWV3_9GLOM|nr:hypothetical protein RhiirA4_467958 [Rhizophagus irregularis]